MRWNYTPVRSESVEALSRRLHTSRVVAELLLRIGFADADDARKFLSSELAGIGDPFLVPNVQQAVERLVQALKRRETVLVFGDYDVDGVCSTALLVSILRRLGLQLRYVVPLRIKEGYGLTRIAVDRAIAGGKPDLFIALDCGTNSIKSVAYLRKLGVDIIVVDHHRSKEELLINAILINPHVNEAKNDHAWRHLCTVGLVFKLLHGLLKRLRTDNFSGVFDIRLKEFLGLVAMGTIADVVPLHSESRIFARYGLKELAATSHPGLIELMRVSGLKRGRGVSSVDISFRLGPRINASGRLADAAISVDLLLSEDQVFCAQAAQRLENLNRERQKIECEIMDRAEKRVKQACAEAESIVLFDEAWHLGVVGIVAGRLSRKYHRPVIILGNEGDLAKGSGRSVPGFNLVELLVRCAPCLSDWGGHPMAVGVSVLKTRLDDFRSLFEFAVKETNGKGTVDPCFDLSIWLDLVEVHERLLTELDVLHPFGQGNPEPLFGIRGVRLARSPELFNEINFHFFAEDARGRLINGVAWKLAHKLPPVGRELELVAQLNWNYYSGRKSLQLELHDWREV